MEELKLSSENYKKHEAINKAGFKADRSGYKYILRDLKNPNADSYMDTVFDSLNDILQAIKSYLTDARIILVA